jgi:hypothetical protein
VISRTRLLLLLCAVAVAPACGKKGPPLAPLLKVATAPGEVAVRRVGGAARIQFRVPTANTDGTTPADIRRVEVYGFTGEAPTTPAEVVKSGTLVATVPVRLPPEPVEPAAKTKPRGGAKASTARPEPPPKPAAPRPPRPPASMAVGFDQGDLIAVTEELGPAQAVEVEVKRRGKTPTPVVSEDPWQPVLLPPVPKGGVRLYYVVSVNHKGQRGTFTTPQPVALTPPPATPLELHAGYDASAVTISWAASPDVPRGVQPEAARPARQAAARTAAATRRHDEDEDEPPAPTANGQPAPPGARPPAGAPGGNAAAGAPGANAAAQAEGAGGAPVKASLTPPGLLPSVPLAVRVQGGGYNIYEVPAAAAKPAEAEPKAPVEVAMVAPVSARPLNDQPVEKPTLTLTGVEYGKTRCFAVRAVARSERGTRESLPSEPACITPADTFAPAAPKNLAAVGSDGAVNLIWEAVAEQDLVGYLVMRAEPGQAPAPVTPQPIKETTYRDTTATRGVRYVYTVLAVDTAGNRSAPSNGAEESAR